MERKAKTTKHPEKTTKHKNPIKKDPTLEDPNKKTKVSSVKVIDPSFGFTLERVNEGTPTPFNCKVAVTINLSLAFSLLSYTSNVGIGNKVVRNKLNFQIPFGDENFPTTEATFTYTITVTLIDPNTISTPLGEPDILTGSVRYTPQPLEKIATKKVSK